MSDAERFFAVRGYLSTAAKQGKNLPTRRHHPPVRRPGRLDTNALTTKPVTSAEDETVQERDVPSVNDLVVASLHMEPIISKTQAAEIIGVARVRAGVTWEYIAEQIGKPAVWMTAALLGQHPMSRDDALAVGHLLDLDDAVVETLQMQPYRGPGTQQIPTDPTVYRFHEALMVYGPAIKELIHEKFGDGIMSAINFRLDVERRSDPEGDRVVVTLDGKFLDYHW